MKTATYFPSSHFDSTEAEQLKGTRIQLNLTALFKFVLIKKWKAGDFSLTISTIRQLLQYRGNGILQHSLVLFSQENPYISLQAKLYHAGG